MKSVKEYISKVYPEEEIIIFDGLDEAFIGVGYIFNKPHACYDKLLIFEILVKRDCMTYEEANEYFEFNIAGLYAGESTPMLLEVR